MATNLIIPFGMLFRKMYCVECGTKLLKHKIVKKYKKGEPGFQGQIRRIGSSIINIGEYKEITYVYKCPNCERITTYEKQLQLAKKQKALNKKTIG